MNNGLMQEGAGGEIIADQEELSLTSYMTWLNLLKISQPRYPYQQNGDTRTGNRYDYKM